jgi:hypothetical protein
MAAMVQENRSGKVQAREQGAVCEDRRHAGSRVSTERPVPRLPADSELAVRRLKTDGRQ